MGKSIIHSIGLVVALCLVAAGGVVHGVLTDRWNISDDSAVLAGRFDAFPENVGDWKLASKDELTPEVVKMLECDGYLSRSYVNDNTGESVKVAVILGPSGPISVHTPEICYSSREYSIEQTRESSEIIGSDGTADQMWRLKLRANDLHAHRLAVYYGWTTDGTWQASDNPRFSFANEPYLVKVQVAGRVSQAEDDSTSSDPCSRFLKVFNSQLREHLFNVSSSADGS